MHDAALDFHLRKHGLNGLFETAESIHTGNENIGHTSVFQVGDHPQPETGTFLAIADPMP
jgi:hypothetical protein